MFFSQTLPFENFICENYLYIFMLIYNKQVIQ